MVPSSIQWTMTPSVHILVYPISRYVISPVKKSPGTIVRRRVQRRTATASRTSVRRRSGSRVRRRLTDNFVNRQYLRSRPRSHMHTYPPKRSPYRHRNGCSRSQYDKRSRDTRSSSLRSAIHRRGKQEPQDRKHVQDEHMNLDLSVEPEEEDEDEEEDECEELEVEDCDYDGDNDNINDDDYEDDDDDDDKVDKDEDDRDEYEEQLVLQWPGAREEGHKRSGETQNRVMRRSANVVLLAHGNRSLYVLTIQRNQVTSVVNNSFTRYRNRHSSSTAVISYKLPGGQFNLTDDEQHNYHRDGRNTCTCPDDQRWYSAAINYFMTQLTTHGQKTPATPATATMPTATTGQAVDDRPQFMPLGNWYRTQQDDDYKTIQAAGGAKYGHHHCSNSNYYPYKPAHVSHQLAGHKRVYAVLDACRLFPSAEHTFQLQAPHAKTKTVTTRTKTATAKTKTTTVTITTTYKCKFVPLARLHENSRLYGPVLSSLPAVLSGLNLVCSP